MAAPEIETVNLLPDHHFSIPSMRGRIADRLGLLVMRYFKDFLRDFGADTDVPMNVDDTAEGSQQQKAPLERKYTRSLWEVVHEGKNTIAIDFKDMELYNDNLAKAVLLHYYRCYPFLCQAVLNCIRDEFDVESVKESLARRQIMVAFTNTPVQFSLRDLRCNLIGQLVRITGQVVRTTPVHPELTFGHFDCELCGAEIPEVEQQFRYVQPTRCSNDRCQNTNKFKLNLNKSMCVDFQKVRVQETQAELPRGAVPRTLDVIVRGAAVETANPGDECHFYGCLLVVPDISALSGRQPSKVSFQPTSTFKHQPGMEREGVSGLKALGVRELTYRVVFLAHNCESSSVKYGGIGIDLSRASSIDYIRSVLTDDDLSKLYEMSLNPNVWRSICDSLFPTIYGSEDVKKGIVLQLFGGVIKYTPEGTQLRGDINICIVGDPSTAKSQFLKQIQQFYPRAVYTSGKASTAAGLTAAVVKDEETHEFVIEAGALMLADRSICCIDEFDKMDIRDQVAIHEAMEQQTISIAKAGVKATLNARASILAAANPIGGRYDKTKSLRQNVYLSAPIMSRFDLLFVLIDDCDENVDRAVATRILDLHTGDLTEKMKKDEEAKKENGRITYSKEDVQRYIIFAKQFRPIISPDAEEVLVRKYLQLRRRDRTAGYGGAGRGGGVRGAFRTTVRQLESLVRLSEAIARMQCLTQITPAIVEQAFDLLSKSIVRVEEPEFVIVDAADNLRGADEHAELVRNTAAVAAAAGAAAGAPAGGLTIPYAEFVEVSNKLLERVTHCDRHNIDVHRSDLVQWYLESIEAQIEDEADLAFKELKTKRIIGQMVKDKTLLEVRDRDLMPATGQEPPPAEDTDAETQTDANEPLLILNPNAQLPESFLDADEPYEDQPDEGRDADAVDADVDGGAGQMMADR